MQTNRVPCLRSIGSGRLLAALAGGMLAGGMLPIGLNAQTTNHVTVTNPSFESPVLAKGGFDYFDGTTGWINDSLTGAIHPDPVYYPADGIDGINVMFVNGGGGHQTLSLSALTLQARTKLILSARVASNGTYPPVKSDYSMGLTFVNRTVIPAPVSSNTPDLVSGGFITWTFTYEIPASGIVNGVNVVGQNATIELARIGGGNQINYDLVTLDVIILPRAGTVVMVR